MLLKIIISLILSLLVGSQLVFANGLTTTHDLSVEVFEDRRAIPNGGDFTLMSSKGPRSLRQYKDNMVILLFGYLSCPDICPTQLKKVSSALKKIDPQERDKVKILFITLDPERDNLEHLDKFVEYFDKNIIALTGEPKQIRQVADLYGVKFTKEKTADGKSYVIHHSVANYILSPDNVIRYILSHDVTSYDIVHVIHNLFKKYYPTDL